MCVVKRANLPSLFPPVVVYISIFSTWDPQKMEPTSMLKYLNQIKLLTDSNILPNEWPVKETSESPGILKNSK